MIQIQELFPQELSLPQSHPQFVALKSLMVKPPDKIVYTSSYVRELIYVAKKLQKKKNDKELEKDI